MAPKTRKAARTAQQGWRQLLATLTAGACPAPATQARKCRRSRRRRQLRARSGRHCSRSLMPPGSRALRGRSARAWFQTRVGRRRSCRRGVRPPARAAPKVAHSPPAVATVLSGPLPAGGLGAAPAQGRERGVAARAAAQARAGRPSLGACGLQSPAAVAAATAAADTATGLVSPKVVQATRRQGGVGYSAQRAGPRRAWACRGQARQQQGRQQEPGKAGGHRHHGWATSSARCGPLVCPAGVSCGTGC